jgi:hypothetical protein
LDDLLGTEVCVGASGDLDVVSLRKLGSGQKEPERMTTHMEKLGDDSKMAAEVAFCPFRHAFTAL